MKRKKLLLATMYNHNYGGLDCVRVHSKLLTLVYKPKIFANLPVTDGYTRPLYCIKKMKKELIQIYVDYKSTLLNELELIQNVNNWFDNNSDKIKPECFDFFIEIQRLNTKSSERNNAFPILGKIIDIIEPNFESIKKPYYLIALKKGCESLISKTISPYNLSRILTQIECEFDFPKWTGNLYDVLDWIEKDSPLELNMIEESKERIIEIKRILKTQYNNV